jgi:insertion element IS1 protein InsB
MNRPYCQHKHIVKNGSNGVGTQKFLCNSCLRQFVENPKNTKIEVTH